MRRSFDRSRVDMMRAYAETGDCRRAFILSYFGEPFEPPCGHCDNCEAGRVHAPPSDVPFAVGARVAHGQWGEGVVQRYDDDSMVVLFDEAGYKTLALDGRARAPDPQRMLDRRPDRRERVEPGHVRVADADAAVGRAARDQLRLVGAVDADDAAARPVAETFA